MRDVANPIAISPYYTNQTTEGFVDPGYTGTKIPDYKKILLENVVSETPGDVLIAGYRRGPSHGDRAARRRDRWHQTRAGPSRVRGYHPVGATSPGSTFLVEPT